MALLILEPKTLELKILVGVLEKYAPDKEIKNINSNLKELKDKTTNFLKDLTGFGEMDKSMEFLKGNPEKNKEFIEFVKSDFNEDLIKLTKRIESKNMKICPNYKDKKE